MSKNDNINSHPIYLLIVDDEKGFTDILEKRLSKRNIIATKASSGTEAIQILRNKEFNCALVDLKMEDMSGIEVLKIFKNMVPELPVIMLTGHGCEESAAEGISLGADAYLIKPCTLEKLVENIRTAVIKSNKK